MDSRGPVFFIQERYGRKGRAIKVIKFRSMYVDAESRLERYLEKKPEAKEEWAQYKKLRNFDPRVTKVGRVLRKYSLDELPQFLNVLKGDMSLVGPRPYLMEELKRVKSARAFLLLVKPGITGLWQVSGRSLLPFTERLSLDEYYLRNWTFWQDVVILMRTIRVFVSGEGAF
jgi:lipopolysaccharide/colanic/teichoic acid biosynthesis glycosyltransferase